MPFTWIEWSYGIEFSRAVIAAVGEPRAIALHREVGGRVVTEDLTTIYRMLFRVVSVELALRLAGVVWSQYVRDAREVAELDRLVAKDAYGGCSLVCIDSRSGFTANAATCIRELGGSVWGGTAWLRRS